jgi:Clostripain family
MKLLHILDELAAALMFSPALRPVPATVAGAFAAGPGQESRPALMAGPGDSNEVPTVTVQRRRRPTTPAGERETAEAPTRDERPDEPSPPPSGGGGSRPPSGGVRMPGGKAGMGGCLGIVAIVVIIGLSMLLRGGDSGQAPQQEPSAPLVEQQPVEQPTEPPSLPPTKAPAAQPTLVLGSTPGSAETASGGTAGGDTWTVMLYQDADDKVLEQDIYVDFNEAERVGSTDKVKIIAQIDRYKGGFTGDGNWTGTARFLVTRDDDLNRVNSEVLQDLGEVNMADSRTLVDFATWAMKNYPADKYALILSDHGMGWPGGLTDPDPQASARVNAPLAQRIGNMMYMSEVDEALGEIRSQTGLDKFELVGFDACLMGHLEVFNALQPHARYTVASQETEPALGWAYAAFLSELVANPAMTGAELGDAIVKSYIDSDQRIVDNQARAEFVGARGYGVPPPDQVAEQVGKDVTLSAVDLSALTAINQAVNDLAYALQGEDQRLVAQARQYAQSFTSIFGQGTPPSYIDLAHFSALINRNSKNAEVKASSEGVVRALQGFVLSDKKGPGKPGAYGVSVYFPTSQLYGSPVAGPKSYLGISPRFAEASLWDDFLAYHYTGQSFERSAAVAAIPSRSVTAPAAGGIELTPIQKDSDVVSPSNPVLLSTQISGENVGYVKLLVGYVDEANRSVALLDTDYLESSDTRELSGVYYPVWPETGKFKMQFEWEPVVFAINDGVKNVVALFKPESYGRSFEEAVYTVDGTYTFTDGEQRPAKLYFRNGALQSVFGFNGQDAQGAPREIVPQKGDKFTVSEQWMDIGAQGQAMKVTTEPGETLTFGDAPWTWKDLNAAPGKYVVGFIAEDLDGNQYPVYDQVTVTN